MRLLALLPSVVAVATLAACGQTGPLYLPGQEPPKRGLSVKPDTRDPVLDYKLNVARPATSAPKPSASTSMPPSASSIASPPQPAPLPGP